MVLLVKNQNPNNCKEYCKCRPRSVRTPSLHRHKRAGGAGDVTSHPIQRSPTQCSRPACPKSTLTRPQHRRKAKKKPQKLGTGVAFHGRGPLQRNRGVCLRWAPAAGAAAAAAGLEPQPPKGTRGLQEHVMPFIRPAGTAGKKINHTSPPLSFCTFPLGHFFQLHHLV